MHILEMFGFSPKPRKTRTLPPYPGTPIPPPEKLGSEPILPASGGRVSNRNEQLYRSSEGISFISQPELLRLIPLIRKLSIYERNLGQVVHDMVLLTNTGFKLVFSPEVGEKEIDKMKDTLEVDSKNWLEGGIGLHSIVNKLTAQLVIGGAISAEWVPNKNLDGVDYVALVNPEDIHFGLSPKTNRYEAYQRVLNNFGPIKHEYVRLNPITYRYYGFLGDTAVPYGIPVLISALKDLETQEDMLKNINFILKQFGALGFAEVLLNKPGQLKDEPVDIYRERLITYQTQAKKRILEGVIDGVLVGYKDDVEYNFNSTTKNITGLPEVFNINQQLLSNGLKYPYQFMGGAGGTDTAMSIFYTNLLSKLVNLQEAVSLTVSEGIALHLRLKGFNFKSVKLRFMPSTIVDSLKTQQAREIKQRVGRILYADGIISQTEYADEMGYAKPDQPEPRVPIDPDGVVAKQKKKEDRQKDKDSSEKKGREKGKPQPKRKP
jgi:hypothetical protein